MQTQYPEKETLPIHQKHRNMSLAGTNTNVLSLTNAEESHIDTGVSAI